MNIYDASEYAYKNGYEAGVKKSLNEINCLKADIENLKQQALEDAEEIEMLNTSYEIVKQEYDSMFTANRNLTVEIEVLKKIQYEILSKQGDYTTNNTTVCEDCEKLWIDVLLKAKSQAIKEYKEIVKSILISKGLYLVVVKNAMNEAEEEING